ncbi:PepSY domain-containing protein [Thermomonas fusca]|uniref:PepSY domain-containing protein n=1 Tax=Thermomonas fusca TaxID=215690 RepID=UPI000A04A291|nr:PepSY domain-containing protein [Thermomonas fusca]
MKSFLPIAVIIALTASGAALADDDCRRPMAEWQSREAVTAHVTALGVTAERLRIDDGCYEVHGRDSDGNRVGLKIDPTSLAILKLEVRFRSGADAVRYLPAVRGQAAKTSKPADDRLQRAPVPVTPEGSR